MPKMVSRQQQKAIYALLSDLSKAYGHSKPFMKQIVNEAIKESTGAYIESWSLDTLTGEMATDIYTFMLELSFTFNSDMRYKYSPV